MSGSSAVQRCLLITEVLDLICAEIWYSRESNMGHRPSKTLAILARTCRAWSDVALNRLWRDIPGIRPLMRCLDLWAVENEVLVFKRPFTESDRAIINKYAWRVRGLLDPAVTESPATHHALSLLSEDCIFPNLKRLHWRVVTADLFHYIHYYLHPKLEELCVHFNDNHPEQLDILFTIPLVFSPNLHCLRIPGPPFHITEFNPRRLSSALSAWSHLSTLELPDITFEGLIYVAQMNHLNKLKIYNLRSLWAGSESGAGQPERPSKEKFQDLVALDHPFPALQSLHLYTSRIPMAHVTDLIRTFEAAKLKRLGLRFDNHEDTTEDLAQLLQTLLSHCDHRSLCEFRYTHKYLSGTFLNLIRPLLSFTALRMLWISVFYPISLSERQATEIVKSLPKLEKLSVDDEWLPVNVPLNPLTVLIPFTACRRLKHLCISLDASDKASRERLRKRSHGFSEAQNLSLERLTVGNSPISHKEFVASFLSDIFPNLQEITFTCVDGLHAQRWHYVEEVFLPMLSRARGRNHRRIGIEVDIPPEDWTSNWGRQMNIILEEEDVEWSDVEGVDACRYKLDTLRPRVP